MAAAETPIGTSPAPDRTRLFGNSVRKLDYPLHRSAIGNSPGTELETERFVDQRSVNTDLH